MTGIGRLRVGLLALVVAGSAACDDALGPVGEFDAGSSAETMEAVVAATEGLAPAFAGLEAAGDVLPMQAAGLVWDGALPQPSVAGLRAAAESGTAAYIPPELIGVTLVWSEASGSYVESDRTGAPSDGVRIVYYAVDPVTRRPSSPLTELGHVDLRDLSTDASSRVGVLVLATSSGTPVELANYYVDVSVTYTQISLEATSESVGHLSDGTDRLVFDMSQGTRLSDTAMAFTQDYAMELEGRDQAVAWQSVLDVDPETQSGTLSVLATVRNGAERVVLDLVGADPVLEGEVRYQGVAVAFIGGTFEEPEFTDVNGDPLSAGQWAALVEVWQAFDTILAFAEGLFAVQA